MKHIKLFEQFVKESGSEAADFASKMADLEDQLQRENKTAWSKFEKSSSKFWDEINANSWEAAFEEDPNGCMSFQEELESHLKENNSTELDEALNELSMSSVGVRDFLRAVYTNADVIKKLGFRSFKDLVGYIKTNDLEEWDELRDEAKELGVVIAESTITEGTFSPINQLAKDEQDEGFDAKIFVGHFDGRTFKAQSTNKTWPDGTPVMKNFTRDGFKDVKLKGEFQLVDSDRGWWYIQGPASTWYAVKHKDYGTPPFEY